MMLHTHADTMFERETTPYSISHDTFFFSSLERCVRFRDLKKRVKEGLWLADGFWFQPLGLWEARDSAISRAVNTLNSG